MRIVHLSDLHLSKDFKRNNIKKLKASLRHAMKISFDHLVITGDLSDAAKESDFKLLRQILKNFNLLDSEKVSVVIGNHDIFGGVQTAADVLDFPSKCKSIDYNSRVSNFISHFEELFTDCAFISPQKFFPYYKNVGGIGIIGINSVAHYSKIRNPMASTGKVYSEQLADIKKLVSKLKIENLPKIALIHHHFYKNNLNASSPQNSVWNKIEAYTLRLRNKKKLIKVLNECGINLVLHGHSHEVKQYSRKGIYFVNAGGSIENDSGGLYLNVIDYDENTFDINFEKVPLNIKTMPEAVFAA